MSTTCVHTWPGLELLHGRNNSLLIYLTCQDTSSRCRIIYPNLVRDRKAVNIFHDNRPVQVIVWEKRKCRPSQGQTRGSIIIYVQGSDGRIHIRHLSSVDPGHTSRRNCRRRIFTVCNISYRCRSRVSLVLICTLQGPNNAAIAWEVLVTAAFRFHAVSARSPIR